MMESHAPKRHKSLECDIHKCTIKGESWTILVGLFDGLPYEVFGGLSKYVEIPKKIKKGSIIKNGKKDGITTYNLEVGEDDSKFVMKDIVHTFDNPLYGSHTRTLSLALRHGIPVQFIVEQLTRDKNSDMQSFSKVIARVLKNYIPDGTDVSTSVKEKCPSCGNKRLVYSGGCVQCSSCTWTLCG
jgi:ribonucleoside-diphosphate reductase alpha chain